MRTSPFRRGLQAREDRRRKSRKHSLPWRPRSPGFGVDFDATDELLDRYSAVFSKGIRSTKYREAYQVHMAAAPKAWRELYEFGERRHCNQELAKEWILNGLPRYDIPHEYVIFKPLSLTDPHENLRAVIFPVSPVELAGLVMLAGSTMPGKDIIQAPQGTDCAGITAFAYAQADSAEPRAVLGMLGVDGREIMRKRFREDILTLTLPDTLFRRMEKEAADAVQIAVDQQEIPTSEIIGSILSFLRSNLKEAIMKRVMLVLVGVMAVAVMLDIGGLIEDDVGLAFFLYELDNAVCENDIRFRIQRHRKAWLSNPRFYRQADIQLIVYCHCRKRRNDCVTVYTPYLLRYDKRGRIARREIESCVKAVKQDAVDIRKCGGCLGKPKIVKHYR